MTSRALICDKMYNKEFRNDDLKLCFLWYDELLINTVGDFNEKEYFSKFSNNLTKKEMHLLTDIFTHLSKIVHSETIYPYGKLDMRGYPSVSLF